MRKIGSTLTHGKENLFHFSMKNHLIGVANQVQNGDGNGQEEGGDEGRREGGGERVRREGEGDGD